MSATNCIREAKEKMYKPSSNTASCWKYETTTNTAASMRKNRGLSAKRQRSNREKRTNRNTNIKGTSSFSKSKSSDETSKSMVTNLVTCSQPREYVL
ncbi:MAG TPA: hypothetical protein DIC57_09520 [Sphaerochaeta sp.]|nr:hypothetical protein [Sphaerochaeta sp.]